MVELHPLRIIKYGTDKNAQIGIGCLRDGKTALGAVVNAIEMRENDPRFNAGTESAVREGGNTIQMDACCTPCIGQSKKLLKVIGLSLLIRPFFVDIFCYLMHHNILGAGVCPCLS